MGMLGIFSSIGGFSTPDESPVRVDVHYKQGNQLDSNFPLNPNLKYFDFKVGTGNTIELGSISMSTPLNTETEIAIDHRSPAVFVYTNAPVFGPAPIGALGIGISGKNNIPYEPSIADIPTRNGNDPTFNGSMWVSGEFEFPCLPEDLDDRIGVTLNADDVVLALDPAAMITGGSIEGVPILIPTNAIKQFGANASVTAEFNLCGEADCSLGFSVDLADASLILNNENHSDPWLAISGRSNPDETFSLPFGIELPTAPNMEMSVDAFIDKHSPFVRIRGKYDSFAGLPGVKMDGKFVLRASGMSFSGNAEFGPTMPNVYVSGYADENIQEFTGKIETKIGGSVKISFSPSLNFSVMVL